MANKVYFISESYVKNNSVVNLNVEPQLLNMAIQDAQILHIQTILGSKLFKKIESILPTLSSYPTYKTLFDDYIVDATLYWTLYEVLPYIRFKIMNKSVSQQNSDNSTPIDTADLKSFQESFRNKAEFYSQRLADHLINNVTLYPEYTTNLSIEDIVPKTGAYFSGMYLDDSESAAMYRRLKGINNYKSLL